MLKVEREEKVHLGRWQRESCGIEAGFCVSLEPLAACAGAEGHQLRGGRVSSAASRKDAIITPCLTEADCKRRLNVSIYCVFLPPVLKGGPGLSYGNSGTQGLGLASLKFSGPLICGYSSAGMDSVVVAFRLAMQ